MSYFISDSYSSPNVIRKQANDLVASQKGDVPVTVWTSPNNTSNQKASLVVESKIPKSPYTRSSTHEPGFTFSWIGNCPQFKWVPTTGDIPGHWERSRANEAAYYRLGPWVKGLSSSADVRNFTATLDGYFPVGTTRINCGFGYEETIPPEDFEETLIVSHRGNVGFSVQVVGDDITPTINTPGTFVNLAVNNSTKVNYTNLISATDNVDRQVELTCDPLSDTYFPVGFTDVTCTAKDDFGNTNTTTFKVEVRNLDKGGIPDKGGSVTIQKPTDGRPQPEKNGNEDATTWKVVPMKDNPSLYKIVDDKNVNIADLYHSNKSAQQYIDYYKWEQGKTPNIGGETR